MKVSDTKRLKELESDTSRLKGLLVETLLEAEIIKAALRKSGERTHQTGAGVFYRG